ncbi:MFS general substrate transporter [Testicularia cyperi]|uniref:MFS general substrate transporter n=1 Tax=Testicularia cyperi TaxID=1882483 RepID=A0A317XS99_9BASI|nr:MFS general substrate transporter [Testicularia cyperi]
MTSQRTQSIEADAASRPTHKTSDEKTDLEISEILAGNSDRNPGMPPVIPMGTNTGGIVTSEEYLTEKEQREQDLKASGYHEFKWSSLWKPAVINPLNGRSMTFPLFRFWDVYSTAFWLATLGFFVAFLSWFAFSPLMPEAVKDDLKLTQAQVTNANMASLGGTAIVRLAAGPACDRYGPRKVLATLLILGAIPSGMAALVTNIQGLEAVRFFISLLGGTFVATTAYTATFFNSNIVGTANAFAGGWGNLGGGVTVVVMIATFLKLKAVGFTADRAWRLSFPIVPVPCLLFVAGLILLFGKDHPAGKWSQRHQLDGTAIAIAQGEEVKLDSAEMAHYQQQQNDREKAPVKTSDFRMPEPSQETKVVPAMETAQSEPLTMRALLDILSNLRVWMCIVSYCLTFGLETAMDAALPGLMTTLFKSATFSVEDAAYAASTYGLLNIYARPLGGIVSDIVYARWGLRARVWVLLITAISQGLGMIGMGLYCNYHPNPTVGGVIGFIVLIATTGFMANGAVYGVVPFTSPRNVGTASGLVGAAGNVGGLFYTLIYRYLPGTRANRDLGTKFWVAGVVNAGALLPFVFIPWDNKA